MSDLNIVVIIVTYASSRLTINSLASVQKERFTPGLRIRAVVVDNASGDLEEIRAAVIENDWIDWVTLVLSDRNGGFAYGNNLGIQHAFSEGVPDYIYLLNPDAEVRTGAIDVLARFMESRADVGIAGSSIENPDGSEWPIAFRFPGLLSELSGGVSLRLVTRFLGKWEVAREMTPVAQPVDWICGASMLVRSSLITAMGGLDENYFLYFEETDFCLRAKQAGYSTWYVPESRIMHIAGQSTKVTERTARPRRLPAYWFESRRRYFAITFGLPRAILIDLVAMAAYSIGWLKRLVSGRRNLSTPHFVRDLLTHSVIWPRNQSIPPTRSFRP